tara:strand:+ start:1675 stop:3276 length:1602 start_codon:yes stop_codon:yes gene_type:complete
LNELANSSTSGGSVLTGPPPAVTAEKLSKTYGSVRACDEVDIELVRGEIHGVLGENGAGKSTLMKMLIGLVLPDKGSIAVDGKPVTIRDPLDAADLGIGMVHQHFSLVEALTVWENVALGDNSRLDKSRIRDRVAELSHEYGLDVNPDDRVEDLPVGMRQRVELLKCLRRDPSVLILDEPTSVLTPEESEQLFDSLRKVVGEENRAVALVSHRLSEILHATDRITIMRNGAVIDRCLTKDTDANSLARSMVGREVGLSYSGLGNSSKDSAIKVKSEPGDESEKIKEEFLLELQGITTSSTLGVRELNDFSLGVRQGEIFGIAGVEGNGQSSLVEVLSGLKRVSSGSVLLNGIKIPPNRFGQLAKKGVAVIPEDRHDSGVILGMSVSENLLLSNLEEGYNHGFLNKQKRDVRAKDLIEKFEINCTGPNAPLWSLSGGNQQRVVLARETSDKPIVLVASQPTRGLDVGAIEYMTRQLRSLADSGVGVLLISSELDEILSLSDRIGVIFRGKLAASMRCQDADRENLGLLMGRGEL